jgi:hypothetical protein
MLMPTLQPERAICTLAFESTDDLFEIGDKARLSSYPLWWHAVQYLRRQKLIAAVLVDFERLSAETRSGEQ